MEVSEQIIKVLDNLGQKFGIAVDWTQKNVFPYVQQLGERVVKYELTTSILWIVILLIISGAGLALVICEHKGKIYGDGFPTFFGYATMMVTFVFICVQAFDIVTCFTFPEKVWIDYIQSYMQNGGR